MGVVVGLLTDFGLKDSYVGAVKGVLLSGISDLQIVDISHDVPPQNIRFGAFQLLASYKNMPEGSLILSVVDPGVGSTRRVLYAEVGKRKFIAPDNGLLSWVFKQEKPSVVFDVSKFKETQKNVSQTFHARDIMAPLAVSVLKGDDVKKYGKPISDYITIDFPKVQKTGAQWNGQVVAVDSFGNLITNVLTEEIKSLADNAKVWIELGNSHPPLRGLVQSYSDVDEKKLLAIGGSSGFVEISVRNGNASQATHLKEGDPISFLIRT